jgi:hypothetical protein
MRNNYRNRKINLRRKGGGMFDSLKETFSNWSTKISQSASNAWNQTKKATGMNGTSYTSQQPLYPSVVPTNNSSAVASYSTPSTSSTSMTPSSSTTSSNFSYGGKRNKSKKNMYTSKKRGGAFQDNISLTNIASKAAPFSGVTARPHTMVGGPVRMLGGAKSKKHRTKKRMRVKSKKHNYK